MPQNWAFTVFKNWKAYLLQTEIVNGIETSAPSYNIKRSIDYLLGVNSKVLKDATNDKKMMNKAKQIIIREGWVEGKQKIASLWFLAETG